MTEAMDIDLQGEQENPSIEKTPTQQNGLGKTQPREKLNEEDDEQT